MRKMKLLPLVFFCLVCHGSISAQLLGGLRPKFFTLRNARLSVGWYVNGNQSNKDGGNLLHFFTGNLPNDLSIEFEPQALPALTAGLQFDLFAPNSMISISFGGEYHAFDFRFANESSVISKVETQYFRIPAYLKFNLGGIQDQVKGLIMGGGVYSFPISYVTNGASEPAALEQRISLSLLGGLQFRFMGDEKERFNITNDGSIAGEYTRMWLFLRGDYMINNMFGQSYLVNNQLDGILDYRDLNLTIGVALFLGIPKK